MTLPRFAIASSNDLARRASPNAKARNLHAVHDPARHAYGDHDPDSHPDRQPERGRARVTSRTRAPWSPGSAPARRVRDDDERGGRTRGEPHMTRANRDPPRRRAGRHHARAPAQVEREARPARRRRALPRCPEFVTRIVCLAAPTSETWAGDAASDTGGRAVPAPAQADASTQAATAIGPVTRRSPCR